MEGFVLTLSYGNSLKDPVYVKSEFSRIPKQINVMLVRKKSILTSRDIQTSQVILLYIDAYSTPTASSFIGLGSPRTVPMSCATLKSDLQLLRTNQT